MAALLQKAEVDMSLSTMFDKSIYGKMYGNQRSVASNLPTVSDPDKAFAEITRQDYDDYINNFRDFEKRLLDATNDTTLIDKARENAPKQAQIAKDIQRRNTERYGGAGLSAAQRQEQQRALQRGGQLSLAGDVNNARINQRQLNQATLQDLIGIGQGLNTEATNNLASSAANTAARKNAYGQAKANYSSQMTGLGTTMLLAAFGV